MINWWYIENNRKMGPVSESELLSLFSDGKIGLATLLWRAGLEAWTPLEKIPELDDIRAEEPPPIPFAEDLIVISEGSQKEHAPVPERRVERTPIWSRYFARQFDIMWESILIIFLAASIFTFLNPSFSDWVSKDSNDYLFAFLVFPFVFVFDAGIYRLFGNTPGKALNGIKISTVEGNALSFSQYLSRNFVVWVQVACGIPLVCFIPMYLQSRRLRNGQKASQDETDGYNVVRIMPRPLSRVCFVLAYLGVAMIFGIMNEIDKSQSNSVTTTDSGSPLNSPIPSYSWTNPQTNSVVTIDGSWTYETKQNNQNENYYEFSNSQGSIVVVFGNEIESENSSIGDYIKAFRSANASRMSFSDAGTYSTFGNQPSWAGTGILSSSPTYRLSVKIVQYGSSFWRQVVLNSTSSTAADTNLAKLQDALWSTLGH